MRALPPDTVAYDVEYQESRSRLTTFFRYFTAIPHFLYLFVYSIPVFFVIMYAWFVVVFTGRFPEKPYNYIERYERYSTMVNSYFYLATDAFPPFNGRPETPYAAQLSIGPPMAEYSRAKAFFRIILLIPVYFIAYAFSIVAQIGAIAAWFVIVFTGKMPKGLHDFLVLGLSYVIRAAPYYYLQTESWPKFTDQDVEESISGPRGAQLPPPPPPPPGSPVGGFAPPTATPEGTQPPPPPPPAPPAPPSPPAPREDPPQDPPAGGIQSGDPLR